MSDRIYLGKNAAFVQESPSHLPYSKVVIIVEKNDDGTQTVYEAGDDTGRTLEVKNPLMVVNNPSEGNQVAADILARIQGYAYKPFEADDAILDPAAEIGDAVTINGLYSLIASIDADFNTLGSVNISAPNTSELDHEYPYTSNSERKSNREAATIVAELRVMGNAISSKISSADAQTLISQGLNSITISASAGSNQSTVTIEAGGITVDSAIVQFSSIEADTIVANASIESPTITGGTITGGTFQVTGQGANSTSAYYVYRTISSSNKQLVGYLSYDGQGSGSSDDAANRMFLTTTNSYPLKIRAAGNMSLESYRNIYFNGGQLYFSGEFILDSSMFGSSLPSSGTYGQLFFLLS